MNYPDWIAVDWGTSQVRAWSMSQTGDILNRATSDLGMGKLAAGDYEPALLQLIGSWLDREGTTPVICCGMVGSREGWIECHYESTPCDPTSKLTSAPVTDSRIEVWICTGVKQSDPTDVMRGEETQVAGLLVDHPNFEGVICLPGTHSKWVRIEKGRILSFKTFMTGELFSLLAETSTLRHTISAEGWEREPFLKEVDSAFGSPASITSMLFSLRADGLINNLDGVVARSRLSGYLIGVELAASRPWWATNDVTIVGTPDLSHHYEIALEALGVSPLMVDVEAMTLTGLQKAFERHQSLPPPSPPTAETGFR